MYDQKPTFRLLVLLGHTCYPNMKYSCFAYFFAFVFDSVKSLNFYTASAKKLYDMDNDFGICLA